MVLRDNFVNGALKQWEFEGKPDITVSGRFTTLRFLGLGFSGLKLCRIVLHGHVSGWRLSALADTNH